MIRSNDNQLFSRPKMDQVVNRYPKNIVKVARKDLFHKIIQIGEHFYPEAFDFVPRTFFFPDDYQKFQNYHTIVGKNATYVAKPINGSMGIDIKLFKELKELSSLRCGPVVV